MVIMCSVAAAVQGMDESVINGANIYFIPQFGIEDRPWIKGLVNAAPYLCCFTIGCWLTHPLNKRFGRRNTIFIACLISAITCFWQGTKVPSFMKSILTKPQVLQTAGGISSSLVSCSVSVSAPSLAQCQFIPQNVPRQQFEVP